MTQYGPEPELNPLELMNTVSDLTVGITCSVLENIDREHMQKKASLMIK